MLVEHTDTGWTVISEMRGDEGRLVTKKYLGFSDEEAKRLFRKEYPDEDSGDSPKGN